MSIVQPGLPVGSLAPFAGTAEPAGWLFCYGQAVSRTTYSALFAVLSTTYGTGDGSTTFNLPDMRGRTVAGKDDMGGSSANRLTGLTGGVNGDNLAATGGAESHTLVAAEIPSHQHQQLLSQSAAGGGGAEFNLVAGSVNVTNSPNDSFFGVTSLIGGGGAHNNVQPTIILNYIIKY